MKQTTIDKIIRNAANYRADTVIGRYTYRVDQAGQILRCKTEDIGREWIDEDGSQHGGWEVVANV